jgi:predicted Zn-dependent protease
MGRLDYRLSNLNVGERAAAVILFGGLPKNVSMGNAIDYYQKAVDNRPDYILYQLDLAKALIQDKQRDRAKKVLQDLIRVEPYTEDDPEYLEDARQLLERL